MTVPEVKEMGKPTQKELKKICGNCRPEDPEIECNPLCETAEWKLQQLRLNNRLKKKTYSEQSPYIKGLKLWLNLNERQTLVVSKQGRDVLDFYGVDEKKFVEQLKALFLECFSGLPSKEGYDYRFEFCSVSKAKMRWLNEDLDDGEIPHIRIDIYDCSGQKSEGSK